MNRPHGGRETVSRFVRQEWFLGVAAATSVIFMVFESRPNVAVEAFSLALKSGNVMILRGGKESMRTTAALYAMEHGIFSH